MAEAKGAPLPTTRLVCQFYAVAEAAGEGNLDFSTLILVAEEQA